MAITVVSHKPNLTAAEAKEVFRRHFEGRYAVEDGGGAPVGPKRDFLIVKSPFVGVSVRLEQTGKATKFVYTGLAPRWWARMLMAGGLLAVVLFYRSWNGLTNEVRELLETAPEFQ